MKELADPVGLCQAKQCRGRKLVSCLVVLLVKYQLKIRRQAIMRMNEEQASVKGKLFITKVRHIYARKVHISATRLLDKRYL